MEKQQHARFADTGALRRVRLKNAKKGAAERQRREREIPASAVAARNAGPSAGVTSAATSGAPTPRPTPGAKPNIAVVILDFT